MAIVLSTKKHILVDHRLSFANLYVEHIYSDTFVLNTLILNTFVFQHIYLDTFVLNTFIYIYMGKSVHIFIAKNRISISCLMTELCFHRFVRFDCFPIYIFGFHHKQCASGQKDFTFVKFNSQLFSSANESLKNEAIFFYIRDFPECVDVNELCVTFSGK